MADWELLVPGIGLSVLGIAGVAISLAGVARTFMEGMHAMSALMLFIGLIIFAAGILKDGLPRSNQAKAAALVIIGFLATLGAFGAVIAEVPSLATFAGVLLLILLPAAVIAWAAAKKSPHFKAITILFSSSAVVGIIAFSVFGMIAPQPIEAGVLEQPEEPEITGPTFDVTIPDGAQIAGNQAYDPEEFTVQKGTTIIWTNADSVAHTVTSGIADEPDTWGLTFDSENIRSGDIWALNTSELETGEYVYLCTFHPFMVGKFTVGETESEEPLLEEVSETQVEVEIVVGASNQDNEEFYIPEEITVEAGTTVVWTNLDTEGHTVTSGVPDNPDEWGQIFDSGFPLIKQNEKFEFTFTDKGEYIYFCQVHPWMVGKVIVE